MAFGTFASPGLPAGTMSGTQAPQKLFGDMPAGVSQIPGMVTPQTTVAMPSYVDWDAINRALGLRGNSPEDWARAAAINNANFARQARGNTNSGWNQDDVRTPTANQTSGMGAQYQSTAGGGSPLMMWAPRNLQGPQLGTWASQQQDRAVRENRQIPMIMQAHTGDPFSPGETQGGSMGPMSSRGLYGPGLTSAIGLSNPTLYAKWLGSGGGGGGGKTKQGVAPDVFPEESLQQRTQSSRGPQYLYDMWGGR